MASTSLNVTRAAQLGGQLGAEDFGPSPGPIYLPKRFDVLSNVNTEPRVLLGTAPRFPPSHHADVGPGPGAYQLSPPGKGPAYSVRGRERFGSQMFVTTAGNPGPGTHSKLDTAQTRARNAPAFSMRAKRSAHSLGDPTPAPGHSQRVHSGGGSAERQVESTKPNVPGMKFGSGGRPDLLKPTTGDIGPGEYEKAGEVRMIAGYRNAPAFSLSFRHPPPPPATLAAEYKTLPRGLGKQVVSTAKTAPSFTMSGRTRFCGYRE